MTSRQVTRAELRSLYAKTQEERIKQVAQIAQNVTTIYDCAVRQAKESPATIFTYIIPQDYLFYLTNMSDIVTGLYARFPDSSITPRSILRRDGKDHDISNLDPVLISLLGHGQRLETIVIDWS
jgi:hypothetical protein